MADEPRLSLVVLDLDQTATEDGLPKETEDFVTRILKQHGKGFRKHANMLIFLAPDQQRSSEVIDAARRLLALRSIDDAQDHQEATYRGTTEGPGGTPEGSRGPPAWP